MSAHSDATFMRMFLLVLGALVAFTVIIMFAARMIGGSLEDINAGDPLRRAALEERIGPVGRVRLAQQGGAAGAAAPAAARSGADVYQSACFACHGTGAAGAPKVGDQAAWAPRVEEGLAHLIEVAIAGKGAMPPRGGNPAVTDEELRAAITHMLKETGIEISETEAPHAPAAEPAGHVEPQEQAAAAAPGAATAAEPAAAGGVDLAKGEEVYKSACFACHDTGAAGAPKLGDTAAWAPRIGQGSEALLHSAINGKNAMPPKGGRMDLSDIDVTSAVAFILSKSQ